MTGNFAFVFTFAQCESTLMHGELCSVSLVHLHEIYHLICHLLNNVDPASARRFLCIEEHWQLRKKFGYNKSPLTKNNFFCICLSVVRGIQCLQFMKFVFAFHQCELTLSLSLYLELCHLVVFIHRNKLTLEWKKCCHGDVLVICRHL